MTTTQVDLTTSIVQIIKGGEPDEDGFTLIGHESPRRITLCATGCACRATALMVDFWELVEQYDVYSPKTDIWLRIIPLGETAPLPEGASLLEERSVFYGIG
ncbi:hypothetical protein CLV63_101232 [Murinocardiopsis flavida]|uniref:Uncharacterized protein n=1 Tax=Murinocardiopsis flavida TaxID=645275 RepID=A0A2P8DU59_9ACTN|nr:hypothetical protein [Murinocardiopsis flavida]PSL00756.1 hypothetical protein CLV63_101232 [Murinocardiopsis flavida]